MDHPGFVRGLQRLGDLFRNRQRLVDGDRTLRDPVSKGRSFDQLQDERLGVVGLLNAVDGGDTRGVEAGEHLRLPLEPGEPIRVSRRGVGQDLQRDIMAELRIGGLIDLSHPSLADEGGHVVVAEAGADGQSHSWVRTSPFYLGPVAVSTSCTEWRVGSVRFRAALQGPDELERRLAAASRSRFAWALRSRPRCSRRMRSSASLTTRSICSAGLSIARSMRSLNACVDGSRVQMSKNSCVPAGALRMRVIVAGFVTRLNFPFGSRRTK